MKHLPCVNRVKHILAHARKKTTHKYTYAYNLYDYREINRKKKKKKRGT